MSDKSKMVETKERGYIELPSDLEKYFALKRYCGEYCNNREAGKL